MLFLLLLPLVCFSSHLFQFCVELSKRSDTIVQFDVDVVVVAVVDVVGALMLQMLFFLSKCKKNS